MKEVLTPEICVIGSGPAARAVASAAVGLGVSTVLIEQKPQGNSHPPAGCIASKALIAAAGGAQAVRSARAFGIGTAEPRADFEAVMDHLHRVGADLAPNEAGARFAALGVRVLAGEGHFVDDRGVVVENVVVYARRFVIATGSRPVIPPIPNLQSVPYFTGDTILELKRVPGHLVVLGAGRSGLELAQAFRRLGSRVTVLEAERALPQDDPELVALLIEGLRAEGVDIRERAEVVRVIRRGRSGVRLLLEGGAEFGQIDATHLLVATSRRPDIEHLRLKQARVEFDDEGIKVNRRLRTRNPRVYAIGDAISGARLPHWGVYQASLVVRSILFRFGGRIRPEILPWVTFTDPELAHVGLSETEARRRFRRIRVLRWPFSENDRARTERSTRGLVKIVTTSRGTIVGADILGADAGELIAPLVLAVAQRMTIRALATAVFPYPTRADALQRAALLDIAQHQGSPFMRAVVGFLRRFG